MLRSVDVRLRLPGATLDELTVTVSVVAENIVIQYEILQNNNLNIRLQSCAVGDMIGHV